MKKKLSKKIAKGAVTATILLIVFLTACTMNVTPEREDAVSMQEPLSTNEIVSTSEVNIEKEKSPANTEAVEQNLQATKEYSLQGEDGETAYDEKSTQSSSTLLREMAGRYEYASECAENGIGILEISTGTEYSVVGITDLCL